MVIDQLCGLEFDMERRNCYTLLRDFYRLNYGIVLSDYACPTDWWEAGLDIYRDIANSEGFQVLHDPPHMWRTGDVVLMALHSRVGNHIGIIVPGGKLLHHLRDCRSKVDPYGGWYRNSTVAVYRHSSIPPEAPEATVELLDVLPKHLAKRLASKLSQGPSFD